MTADSATTMMITKMKTSHRLGIQVALFLTLFVILYVNQNFKHQSFQKVTCAKRITTGLRQLQLSEAQEGPLWIGDIKPTSPCEFLLQDAFNFHFPHTMQQLYRCWSLWRHQTQPVLVFPRKTLPENAFIQGYITALERSIGLRVIRRWNGTTNVPRVPPNTLSFEDYFQLPNPPYYAWETPYDAKSLRDTVVSALRLPEVASCGAKPRITILNRQGTRVLANADFLYKELKAASIVEFDFNTTFYDQVNTFRSSDIVLSPHGAQLTGIPFLPDCGGVLEVFPVGYYLPHFFGSLAAASRLLHGFVLLTKSGDWVAEAQTGMYNSTTRNRVRSKSLCPDSDSIRDSVEHLILQWYTCCAARDQE